MLSVGPTESIWAGAQWRCEESVFVVVLCYCEDGQNPDGSACVLWVMGYSLGNNTSGQGKSLEGQIPVTPVQSAHSGMYYPPRGWKAGIHGSCNIHHEWASRVWWHDPQDIFGK
jgi:hypothetical protein